MSRIKTGLIVKTRKKYHINDPHVAGTFIRNRCNTEDSIIDSPVYLKLNKLWLVKHNKSKLVRGISIGYYGVYHEDEIEIVDLPPLVEEEEIF